MYIPVDGVSVYTHGTRVMVTCDDGIPVCTCVIGPHCEYV